MKWMKRPCILFSEAGTSISFSEFARATKNFENFCKFSWKLCRTHTTIEDIALNFKLDSNVDKVVEERKNLINIKNLNRREFKLTRRSASF